MTVQVYTLNTETWKWTEHTSEVEGESPSPRFGHCAVALPDDRHLATFGGCDQREDMFFSSVALLDTLTWRWNTPKIQVVQNSCPFQACAPDWLGLFLHYCTYESQHNNPTSLCDSGEYDSRGLLSRSADKYVHGHLWVQSLLLKCIGNLWVVLSAGCAAGIMSRFVWEQPRLMQQ